MDTGVIISFEEPEKLEPPELPEKLKSLALKQTMKNYFKWQQTNKEIHYEQKRE